MRVRRQFDNGGEVAQTILQQLGGAGRLNAMTGAYNFVNRGNGLSFRIKNQRANYIKITLTPMDLYDIEVGRVRGGTYKVVKSDEGLYADQLRPFIEQATGMYLTFGRGFAKGGMVSVETEDGENLQYKLDKDEMSLEVNEFTMQYLADIVLVMKRDFRKLADDKYIFWYDELSPKDLEELEELFQVSLLIKKADGGNINIDDEYGHDDSRWYVIEDGFMIKGGIGKAAAVKISEILAKKNPNKKYSVIWIEDYESDETDERGFQYAKGGLYATGITSKKEIIEQIKRLKDTIEAQNELKEELNSGDLSDYEIDLIENNKLPKLSEDESYYRSNLEFSIRKYNIEHGKDLSIPNNLYVFMKSEGFSDGGKIKRKRFDDGGDVNWGEDLGDGFSVGNDVYITDSKSLYKGKTGFVSGVIGKDLLVTISENGNERSVVVSKKGVEKLDAPEFSNGGETGRIKKGDVVRIENPFPDEDPNQLYLVVQDSIEEYGEDDQIDVQALGTGLSFPPINRIEMRDLVVVYQFAKGGKIKKRARFVEKVDAIADRLEGEKVPKRLRKDYGVRYNRSEAEEAGRRIAGAQLRDYNKK